MLVTWLQNTDVKMMMMVVIMMMCTLSFDCWFAEKHVSLIKTCLKLGLSPKPTTFNQLNYTSKSQINLGGTNVPL